MTSHLMCGCMSRAIGDEFRHFDAAALDHKGTAGMEAAARGRIERARHLALQDHAGALGLRLGHGDRRQQRAAIGMTGRGEQRLGVRGLDDGAEIHHRDAVGDVLDHREVVRDENIGKPEPLLQVPQQVEDLRTDRDVERRDRLVADDQFRLDRERARDRDALALAAGKFVGVAARKARLEPDQPQQFLDPRAAFVRWHEVMQHQRLAEDLGDRHARVERGVRVLEDDLRLPAERAQCVGVEAEQVTPFETDAAGVRLDQAQHQAAHGRLAAAGFADQGQRLAGIDVEADAIDRPNESGRPAEQIARSREMLDQVLGFQQRGHLRPSPRTLPRVPGAVQRSVALLNRTSSEWPGEQRTTALRLCCAAPGARDEWAQFTTPAFPAAP